MNEETQDLTLAHAQTTLMTTRPPHGGACWAECVRSAPLRVPRNAAPVVEGVQEHAFCFVLHTILPSPILYGIYCNHAVSEWNTIVRNIMGDAVGGWSAQTNGVACKE